MPPCCLTHLANVATSCRVLSVLVNTKFIIEHICTLEALQSFCAEHVLQAFAGIVTVSAGHCHPKVTEAVQSQMSKLQHTTTIYLNDQIAQYGKEMAEKMPGNLQARTCNHPRLHSCLPPRQEATIFGGEVSFPRYSAFGCSTVSLQILLVSCAADPEP